MPDENKPENEKELHNWALSLVDDGVSRRRGWEGIWWENIATYCGDFWVEFDIHRRRLVEPVKKPAHKTRIPINLAQPVIRTEIAKLTKNRPITDVTASSNDLEDLNSAKVGDKMINQYAERVFHLARVRRRMLHWTTMCGLGAMFVDWNDKAEAEIEVFVNPKGSPIFDERVIGAYKEYYKKKHQAPKKENIPWGELSVRALSPFQLLWDYSQLYIEDAAWCIVTDVYDVNEVQKRWSMDHTPDADSDVEPGIVERRLLNQMDLTQSLNIHAPTSQNLCKVHRLFVRPGHPYFPSGLHFVFTEEEVIRAEGYPFAHEQLPVAVCGHIPLPTGQQPMSILQQLRGVAVEISKTESQMIDNRNLMANPPWLIPKQARLEGEIVNKAGLKLYYNHTPNVPPPSPVQMPELPSYVPKLVEVMKQHVLEISGQGETSQGRIPPGARSGVAVAYLQEEDDTRLGPTVEEFEETMERANWQILQVIAEKYTLPRTIRLYRPRGGEPDVFDFVGNQLSGVSGLNVQAGSALPRSKAAKQQFILDLWDRKLEQDPRKVREMLELSQGEPDEWEIDMDEAERENRDLLQGQDPTVFEWQNHVAHHYIHRQYMKSAAFRDQSPDIQQGFLMHDAEHDQFERQQQEEQMAMQGQGTPELSAPAAAGNGAGPAPPELPPPASNGAGVGQQRPEGPPQAFQADITPRSMIDEQPQ
jgi:hypothetical protein